jgi:hypothetical protein
MAKITKRLFGWLPNRYTSYRLYYLITALGVIVHELSHKWLAEDRGLEILEVQYFSLEGDTLGHVIHEHPRTYMDLFAVSVAPFIINSSIGISAFVAVGVYVEMVATGAFTLLGAAGIVVGLWVGVSVTLHAFPSMTDLNNIYAGTRHLWGKSMVPVIQPLVLFGMRRNWVLYLVLFPIGIVMRVGQLLIFSIKHPAALLTVPIVVVLDGLDRTQKYGSNLIYTVGVIVTSYYVTQYLAAVATDLIG